MWKRTGPTTLRQALPLNHAVLHSSEPSSSGASNYCHFGRLRITTEEIQEDERMRVPQVESGACGAGIG